MLNLVVDLIDRDPHVMQFLSKYLTSSFYQLSNTTNLLTPLTLLTSSCRVQSVMLKLELVEP